MVTDNRGCHQSLLQSLHITTTTQQPFNGPLSWTTWVSRNVHPLAPILIIHLLLSTSSYTTIHSILPDQFTRLTVFLHNFSPSPIWCTSWPGTPFSYSIHFFTQSLSSFFHVHTIA